MREPQEAIAFLEKERQSQSEEWYNSCERLCRTAYGLEAHFKSANLHYDAIPQEHRFGHEPPNLGDLALMKNNGSGHIVTCTGVGWGCYTNDYGGHGKVVKIPDLRVLVPWCNATEWYIADAWWSEYNFKITHGADMALSDEDVAKIADAVWAKQVTKMWDGKPTSVASVLVSTQNYAIQGGWVGDDPKGSVPTVAKQILADNPAGGNLSDEDVTRVANAVIDLLSLRTRS